ncbi:hypothetical protein MN608_03351 [Microdochium nivale]|nr:hypothetical protein MN608_03351 [Microdochium nivale]
MVARAVGRPGWTLRPTPTYTNPTTPWRCPIQNQQDEVDDTAMPSKYTGGLSVAHYTTRGDPLSRVPDTNMTGTQSIALAKDGNPPDQDVSCTGPYTDLYSQQGRAWHAKVGE